MSLSDFGSWASIISFPISVWAIFTAQNARSLFRKNAIDRKVKDNFLTLSGIPTNRQPTKSTRRVIAELIGNIETFYISKIPLVDSEPKTIVERIKASLQGNPDVPTLISDLELLENLLFQTGRI